jgi:hypothetical protein
MKRIFWMAYCALQFATCADYRVEASILYGGNGAGSSITPGALSIINQNNGSGVFVGDPVTPGGLSGLAFNSAGILWGSTAAPSSPSSLVSINPFTGALNTSVAITLATTGAGVSIGDLAVQPGTNILYGIGSNAAGSGVFGGLLFTINTTTGVATVVGDTGQGRAGGLAFAPNGTLFFAEVNQLHTLNPNTAALITTVAITGGAAPEGLDIRPSDGVLFATNGGPGDDLYTLNTAGISTFLGNTGIGSVSDLAFAPSPEPMSLFVWAGLASVAALVTCRHKRKQH